MCWGVPGRVVEVNDMYAKVNIGGTLVDAVLCVDGVGVGDYVLVHAGLVVGKLSEEELVSNIVLLAEMQIGSYVSGGSDERSARERVSRELIETLSSLGIDPNKYRDSISNLGSSSGPMPASTKTAASVPPNAYTFNIKISLSDTDYLQVVHYTNYFRFCEMAWSELLRNLGFSYSRLIHEYGVFLPTVEAESRVVAPSRLDNELRIYVWAESLTAKSVRWRCVVENLTSGRVSAELMHVAVCTDTALTQSLELPKELVERLREYLAMPASRGA